MSVQQIVFNSESAASTQIIDLDGQEYQLSLRWSQASLGWYADLADDTGRPLQVGRRLSLGSSPFLGLDGPPGAWVVYGEVDDERAALSDGRLLLLYVPATEG